MVRVMLFMWKQSFFECKPHTYTILNNLIILFYAIIIVIIGLSELSNRGIDLRRIMFFENIGVVFWKFSIFICYNFF